MIPLRDENRSGSVPLVTRTLIGLNVVLFLYQVALGPAVRDLYMTWGMVPARVWLSLHDGPEPWSAPALTFLSSMFLHGGWAHLAGNMWYLWIFGDNVEDRLGRARFLAFYVGSGLVAALLHYTVHPQSTVPTVGASGAIAGVLGAYAVAFPGARVITLVPFFPFFQVVALPALVVLGLWFVFQFFSGALALGMGVRGGGGVAWWAHVGGFVFGLVAMQLLGRRRSSRAWVEP